MASHSVPNQQIYRCYTMTGLCTSHFYILFQATEVFMSSDDITFLIPEESRCVQSRLAQNNFLCQRKEIEHFHTKNPLLRLQFHVLVSILKKQCYTTNCRSLRSLRCNSTSKHDLQKNFKICKIHLARGGTQLQRRRRQFACPSSPSETEVQHSRR